jgi:hypothetical protein
MVDALAEIYMTLIPWVGLSTFWFRRLLEVVSPNIEWQVTARGRRGALPGDVFWRFCDRSFSGATFSYAGVHYANLLSESRSASIGFRSGLTG